MTELYAWNGEKIKKQEIRNQKGIVAVTVKSNRVNDIATVCIELDYT